MVTTKWWQRTAPALTRQDVADIRELRGKKVSYRSLAAKFKVSESTIRQAYYGEGAYRGW